MTQEEIRARIYELTDIIDALQIRIQQGDLSAAEKEAAAEQEQAELMKQRKYYPGMFAGVIEGMKRRGILH
ncbi:MAG: hypothetical protein MJZ06_04115 [Bacteroidaceae bacterium]|nr:hypothetical protein [Bacteroidaceae bacterium]